VALSTATAPPGVMTVTLMVLVALPIYVLRLAIFQGRPNL
jgi:hypothetical protein